MQTTISTLSPEQMAFLAHAENSTRRLRRVESFRVRRPGAFEIVHFRTKHARELEARRSREDEIARIEADLWADEDCFGADRTQDDHEAWGMPYDGRELSASTEVLDQDWDEDVCMNCGRFYVHPHARSRDWSPSYPGAISPQRCAPCWDI